MLSHTTETETETEFSTFATEKGTVFVANVLNSVSVSVSVVCDSTALLSFRKVTVFVANVLNSVSVSFSVVCDFRA